MIVSMVMAMDENRLIGKSGGLPWHIPRDLKWFKANTLGKPIVMGRRTWDSLPIKPLPGRPNIVLTRDESWNFDGVIKATAFDQALSMAEKLGSDEVAIIGGATLCQQAMPHVSKLYLTLVHATFEGDTWLDSYEPSHWNEVYSELVTEDVPYPVTFKILER